MHRWLEEAGLAVEAAYGLRVFADYLPAEKLTDPAFHESLWHLEVAAGALDPYKQIGRYCQIIARRPVQ